MVLYQLLLSPIGCCRLLGIKHNLISLATIGFVELVTFGFDIKIPTQGYSKHPALYINSVICGVGVAYMVYNSVFYRLESNLEAWPWASVESEDGTGGGKDITEGDDKKTSDAVVVDSPAGKENPRETSKVCPFTGLEATITCPICQTMLHRAVWHERDPWLTLRIQQGIITLDVDRHGRVSSVILEREHALKARKVAKKNRSKPTRAFPLYARAPPPGYRHSRGWLMWWQQAPFKGYVPFSNGMVPEYSRPCPFDGPPLTNEQTQALIHEEREARHAEANFLTAAISEMCVGCYAHNLCWNVGPRLFYTQVILSIMLTLLLHALDDKFSTLGARVFLDGLSAYYAYSSLLLAFNCVASTRIFQQHYDKLPYKWPLKPWRGTLLWLANFGSSHPEHPPGIPAFLIPESMLKTPLTRVQRKVQQVQRILFHLIATYRVPPDYEPPPEIPPPPQAQAPEAPPQEAPLPPTRSSTSPLPSLNVFGLGVEESKAQSRPSVEWINPDVLSTTRRASMASVIGLPLQAPRRVSNAPAQEGRRPSTGTATIPPISPTQESRRSSNLRDQAPSRRASSKTSSEVSRRRSLLSAPVWRVADRSDLGGRPDLQQGARPSSP